ncbi:uncharacterized protein LOC144364046 [Saccoglossus kowalevskii]
MSFDVYRRDDDDDDGDEDEEEEEDSNPYPNFPPVTKNFAASVSEKSRIYPTEPPSYRHACILTALLILMSIFLVMGIDLAVVGGIRQRDALLIAGIACLIVSVIVAVVTITYTYRRRSRSRRTYNVRYVTQITSSGRTKL